MSSNTTSRRRWPLVLFGVFAVGLLAPFTLATPVRDGDGMEYWYQVESLARHFTPELREDDESAVNAAFPTLAALKDDPGASIDIPPYPATGYETTRDGRRYAAHFWAYPLSAVPVRWLLGIVGGYPMASLQITNGLWFLAALFVVLFRWEIPAGKKLAFAALAFVGPAVAYLPFTGAETFTWANAVLAVVALDQKKFARCSLFACLGATQNPPLALLGVVAVPLALLRKQWKDAGLAALAGVIAVVPMGFYYAHFGKPSLIVGAATSTTNISIERTISMIFDLNQGLMGYVPLLPLAVLVALIAYMNPFGRSRRVPKGDANPPPLVEGRSAAQPPGGESSSESLGGRGSRRAANHEDGSAGASPSQKPISPPAEFHSATSPPRGEVEERCSIAALAVSLTVVGMALAAQTQGNWNGGGAGLHRYLVWMIPPLAWVAADGLGRRGRTAFALGAVVIHLPLLTWFPTDRLSYLEERPLARWVLNHAPLLYSPPVEIFVERQRHGEFADPLAELPAAFARPNGEVTKLLVVTGCESRSGRYVVVSPDYLPELLARIAAADSPTYIHPPRGAVRTNPGALTGKYPNRADRAKPRWRE